MVHNRRTTKFGRPSMNANVVDNDAVLQPNLVRVFSQRDAAKRNAAICELYAPDAVLYEPDAVATGHAAIAHAVDALLASLPPDFVFSSIGPAVGHHDLGRLRWRAGPPQGPVAVTGTDVVRLDGGRIQSLHVFIDPPGA
jgi:hypothetical protein